MPTETTLDDIRRADFGFFVANKNTVSSYYDRTLARYDDVTQTPFYHLYPSYNTAIGDNEYRFLLLTVNGRTWTYRYKIVQILKTRQIRFFGLPTTDGRQIASDVRTIIDALSPKTFVRFVFNERQRTVFDGIFGNTAERLVNHDEFFYSIASGEKKFSSNRWRKKHYVNLFENEEKFTSELSRSVNLNETNVLRGVWSRGMAAKGDAVRPSTERSFQRFIRNADPDTLRVISLRCDGRLVAQEFFLIDRERRICQSLYCIHVFEHGDDLALKHVVNRMVAIQKYMSWKYLKDEATMVYVGTGASRSLYAHKERTCDGKVEYFIIQGEQEV